MAGFLALAISCLGQQVSEVLPALIPKPLRQEMQPGTFTLSSSTKLVAPANENLRRDLQWFNDYLERYYHFRLQVVEKAPANNYILFSEPLQYNDGNEAYELFIEKNGIQINALSEGAGNFYALQSLIQLLPPDTNNAIVLPCLHIEDAPRFQWRGMHLDVCRHFFPLSFVKRYIDLLALYKMNTFHWHLTDDQGWRIEIKRFPLLTQHGAWRKGTMVGRYSDHRYDSIPYGGYYTQEEIRELVEYAASRHITVVPEIEMPGHSVAAISSYPWLSCTGKVIDVERGWGVFEDVFCTKDSVFGFLEQVLDEVIALFPGKYIHIGGDESPKTRWKVCPVCQSVIKLEKLKDEHELQSYFIKRIERYVSSKGRKVIGWDEILEGGLAPNAAVMSWQGIEGGIAAARQQHPVVMSPGSHCYFDHYQAPPVGEPLAIGGFTPLEKVYAFEPVPALLTPKEQPYILGAQANLWTEYILSEKQAEYMALPRMAALAEVLWTPKEQKDETDFLKRIQQHFRLLDRLGYTYARALYRINYTLSPSSKGNAVSLRLSANPVLGELRYTTDGSDPGPASVLFEQPLELLQNTLVKGALFQGQAQKSAVTSRHYDVNKATNAQVMLKNAPHTSYNSGGAFTLVNAEQASLPRISDQWLAWRGNDMEATLRLSKTEEVSQVDVGFLQEELSWIYFPAEVQVYISPDGKNFRLAGKATISNGERIARLSMAPVNTQYIKIVARNHGKIASGKPGAGENAWLFCDEIMIR